MHSRGSTARRIGVGAISTAVVSATLLVASQGPATAASIVVEPSDVRPTATPYAGWHQGYADRPYSGSVTADNRLTLVGKSQIIRGYDNNTNENLGANGVNASLSALGSAKYNVTSGTAFFQLALFADEDGVAGGASKFTTLRPAVGNTGDKSIALTDSWVSSQAVSGIAANTPAPLSELVDKIDNNPYKTIAFGVLSEEGSGAKVQSIDFNGDTYTFAVPVTTSTVTNDDIQPEETPGNYAEWHQGYANAAGNHQVVADGLVLAGKSQVIKGYSNNSDFINAVNANLQFVLPEATYKVEAGSDPVYFQVAVKFDDGGTVRFATLRNTGESAGNHGFGLNETWQSSRAIGAIPANTDATLGSLIAALGDKYKTIGFGVLTNPGDVGKVSQIKFGQQSYSFADTTPAGTPQVVPVRSIAGDADPYEGWHQGAPESGAPTAATGEKSLNLGSNRSQIIKGYENNSSTLNGRNVNLYDALTTASYTVTAGTVYFQVPLFFEDSTDGSTKFATLRPAAAATVGTNTVNVGQEWVSSRAIGSIPANTPVLLGDLLSSIKTYKVLAFGVYQDAGGNGKVSDITWDGVKYTFAGNTAPVAPDQNLTTTAGKAVSTTLQATDADGDNLTYAITCCSAGGTTVLNGNTVTYTPAPGFVGGKKITYTASDGQGGTTTGTIVVRVGKAPTTLKLTSATGGGKNPRTVIRVTPSAPGGQVDGAKVDIRRNGKAVASGTIVNGTVLIKVGNSLKKGTYQYGVYYRGTSTTAAKSVLYKVVVK